jgi:hypothetical protein
MKESKPAYFHKKQMYVHELSPNSKTIVGSRRSGKSDGIIGPDLLYDVQNMPGSTGWIYQDTYKQLLARTLPAGLAFWKRYNYIEDKHYFVGRKAPKWMNFAMPNIQPNDWSKCIHVYNGTVVHMLSQDVRYSANSLTADWGKVDEGRSIRKEKMFEEAIPTLSGTHPDFAKCHKWKGITIVSDMPTTKSGQWVVEMQNRMDPELIKCIEATIAEINYITDRNKHLPELSKSAEYRIAKLKEDLFFFRKNAFLYIEFDAIDNIEIIGEEYIKEQKRNLPSVIFQTSIMNQRIRKLTDGFYPNFSEDIHCYDAFDNSYIDNLRTDRGTLDLEKIAEDNCLADGDINPDVPLAIALDYNSNINWIITGQRIEPEMRTLSSKFVKFSRKLRELCKDWCDYYSYIVNKHVIYYYNETALERGYADEESQSFAEIVMEILSRRGWNVEGVFIGKTWSHKLKHQYINDAMTGNGKLLFPTFNKSNNKYLIPTMQLCGVRRGKSGFEKDKAGEKVAESEDNLLEYRTDGTDAWDDLFIGLNFFPRQAYSIPTATVFNS